MNLVRECGRDSSEKPGVERLAERGLVADSPAAAQKNKNLIECKKW
jgi:hypothetical protein